jgi:hypothetical protein
VSKAKSQNGTRERDEKMVVGCEIGGSRARSRMTRTIPGACAGHRAARPSSSITQMPSSSPIASARPTAAIERTLYLRRTVTVRAFLAGSHTRTVLSSLPEASSRRPSGAPPNATVFTGAGVAGEQLADGHASKRMPEPHRPVVAAGGHRRAGDRRPAGLMFPR